MEDGNVADSQDRVFKILLDAPYEVVDPQVQCGIYIGDRHPINPDITCKTFNVRFDGESRMVMVCTFSYASEAVSQGGGGDNGNNGGGDHNNKPPEQRPANWTTSTSLIEQPVYSWRKRIGAEDWDPERPAINSAGDIYDAVTKLTSIVNISIEQWEYRDPTEHCEWGGYVNKIPMSLGSLEMSSHTVMFRGVSAQPAVESWGGEMRRGWKCTYEFAYKRNTTKIFIGNAEVEVDLGWDVAVPQTGFNVKAFTPPGDNNDDPFGQPLKHGDKDEDKEFSGRIVEPPKLFKGVAPGEKVRAMVKVFSYVGGGASQMPSASPIPLNDNGRPRKETADPKVLVYGYAVQPEVDLVDKLKLRLED